jgi:hypothetical protein
MIRQSSIVVFGLLPIRSNPKFCYMENLHFEQPGLNEVVLLVIGIILRFIERRQMKKGAK